MGSYSGACEIVEARDELNSVEQSRGTSRSQSGISREGNGRKSPVLKLGQKDFLEDDINQLFQAISLKNSSMGPGLSSQASTSTSTSTSPMRKNAMKRPITVGMPHSSGIGNSESLSLKQALRELCISKASEMAAMKRLSMWSSCPGISEAGRIKSLYNSVVVETDRSSLPFDKSKGTMFEISLAPEESGSTSSGKTHRHLRVPKVKSSNQSALTSPRLQALKFPNQSAHSSPQVSCQTSEDVAGMQNESFSWPREVETLELRSVNQSALSSPRSGVPKTQTGIGTSLTQNKIGASSRKVGRQVMKSSTQSAQSSPRLTIPQNGVGMQNEVVSASREFGTQALEYPNQKALSSPRFTVPKMQNDTGTATMENEIASASTKVGAQALKFSNKRSDSSPPVGPTTIQNGIENSSVQRDTGNASRKVGTQALKTDMARLTAATSPLTSVFVNNALKPDINVSISTKATSKGSSSRSGHKGRLRAAGSSVNENRISKVTKNATHLAKPVVRSRSSVKKKIKQGTSCTTAPADGGDCILAPSTGQLVCQRCQCALMNVTGNSDTNFPASFTASLGPEVMASNVNPGAHYSDLSSSNCNRSRDDQTKKTPKSRAKGEFSQSSKSSLGDYSTSTSNSEESNASRSSCCNRPHMSKDIRWEAIRRVKMRDGALSLKHFNLLKKLGCGDIGTVYLAELIGSKYLFAIKVMDNEFLARRKKMPRAQTEREILRILDHPFLPTLYAQFTSENLSCLVMEYCPGGDLHVLRQKQPSRSFLEPAARFYVAEVLLALEYLHMLGIIYRDLKPENILVREDGHIMLTDFDLSLRCNVSPTLVKSSSTDVLSVRISGPSAQSSCIEPLCIEPSCQVPCFTPGFLPAAKARKLKADIAAQFGSLPQLVAEPTDARSNSFVGTHEYLAPEIIKGEGHGAAVDWWTFGVLLYELLYGRTPFKGSGNDVTLDNVVMQSLKFPDTPLVSFQARDLISGLLVKEPENRLGSQKGAAEIKQHPFFEGLNWALIRCAIPPELPEFCDFGVPNVASHDKNCRYLELKATGEHLEFELF